MTNHGPFSLVHATECVCFKHTSLILCTAEGPNSRQMSEYLQKKLPPSAPNARTSALLLKRENVVIHDCGFCFARGRDLPGSSFSPFIHLMVAAGLLPMAVQVISVSLPSLRISSRASMMGLPGGTTTGCTDKAL